MSARISIMLIAGAAMAAQACAALGIEAPQSAAPFAGRSATPDLSTLDEVYRLPAAAPVRPTPTVAHDARVPSGMELTLGALASFGVLRGLRTLKKLPVVYSAPEWYADTAPQQIGHATPLDLNALHLLLACPLTPPVLLDPPVGEGCRAVGPRGSAARRELLIEAPRGPPATHSV